MVEPARVETAAKLNDSGLRASVPADGVACDHPRKPLRVAPFGGEPF